MVCQMTTQQGLAAQLKQHALLERRPLSSEAAEQQAHSELMKACEATELAECNAAQTRQLQEQMQVTTVVYTM